MRRAIAGLVFLLVTVTPARAGAQATPVVRISGTTAMSSVFQCFDADPVTTPGSFTFERDNSVGRLTITYHVSGGPTDLNADPVTGADHTAEFADGQSAVTVSINPATGGGGAHIEIISGTGYTVGDPATADVPASVAEPSCTSAASEAPSNTLPRTGVRHTTGALALTGAGMVALGAILLVSSTRRKAAC